jgi:hypothetical protein
MVVQLPDKRILLHKYKNNVQWSITIERYLELTESPLDCVNDILWNIFGIDPFNYSDNFADIKRFPTSKGTKDNNIVIYIAKLKSSISFQAKLEDSFSAMLWKDLLRDVRMNSICAGYNPPPKHTPNAIIVSRELHVKEVFDKWDIE